MENNLNIIMPRSKINKIIRVKKSIDIINFILDNIIEDYTEIKINNLKVNIKSEGIIKLLLDQRSILEELLEKYSKNLLNEEREKNFIPSDKWNKYTKSIRGWK